MRLVIPGIVDDAGEDHLGEEERHGQNEVERGGFASVFEFGYVLDFEFARDRNGVNGQLREQII